MRFATVSALALVLAACNAPGDSVETGEAVDSTADAIHGHGHGHGHGDCDDDDEPIADISEFTTVNPPIPGGLAGGEKVIFYGSPLEGRVFALDRNDKSALGELPQPPGNFALPLIIHSISPTRIAVLDCGGFQQPGVVDASPSIYEYEYSYHHGTLTATLARTVHFTDVKVGFAEEFVYLGNGSYLVPDAVYGSIWRVKSDGTVVPGIVPKTFAPEDAIPQMVYCADMPQVTVGGIPFLFNDSTIPGVAGIAKRDNTVYFYSSCAGALYKFPYSALTDGRKPWQRASSISLVSKKPSNVQVEELLEMQFNPFDPSDSHLYAADALQLRMIRIDPSNGHREVIGDDPHLFNFPASLGFVPPAPGEDRASLLVLSNQQHRDPLLNDAIEDDFVTLPYMVAELRINDD